MSPYFWWDLVANLVGGLVAGLVILCVAEKTFGLRKERKRRRDERKEEIERALKYLGLLYSEVEGIVGIIPNQVARLKMQEWGAGVAIVSPVWHLVEQSGELVSLLDPHVVQETAWFYEQLGYAKQILDFLRLSWLAPEESVEHIEQKREEMRKAVAETLKAAETSGKKLLKAIDSEGGALADRLQGLG